MLNSVGSWSARTVVCLGLWANGCASGPQVVGQPYPVVAEIPAALLQAVDYELDLPVGAMPPTVPVATWDRADQALWTCNARLDEIAKLVRVQRERIKPQGMQLVEALIAQITARTVSSGLGKDGLVFVTSYPE